VNGAPEVPYPPGPALTFRERALYHQIHPAKLAVDISSSIVSTWLLWNHQLIYGILVTFPPSIAVSALMIWRMNFQRQKDSAFGRYIAVHMTRTATTVRSAGQIVVWAASWIHAIWGIVVGAAIIVLGWTYSLPRYRGRRSAASS
jgi:hypothetical protein